MRLTLNSIIFSSGIDAKKPSLKNRWEKNRIRNDIRDVLYRYLDYDHGPIERLTINGYFAKRNSRQREMAVPRYNPKKSYSLQARLDKELLPKGVKSMMID